MEYYPRKIEEELEDWLKRKEILLVIGPRQSGKTTLFLHLKEIHGGNYVTLEDDELLEAFEKDPKEFVKRYLTDNKNLLFVDEAQYSKSAGKNLKLLYDHFSDKIKLLITGSGSFDIKVEVGKYLVGRAIYFELMPLDFEEFLMWKAKDLHKIFIDYGKSIRDFLSGRKNTIKEPIFRKEFKKLLEEYIIYGGYPSVVKEKDIKIKKDILKNLTRTYLEKDIFFFFNIMHLEKFKNLMNYLSFNNGSIIENSSIMRELHMDYKTIENYMSILSNTSTISLLSPYHRNLTTELKKAKKIYFRDSGLRNSIINNFLNLESRTDRGTLYENFILNELSKNFKGKLNYWRTTGKAEVDFVLNIDNKLVPIEVKSKTKPGRSFLSFIKTYNPDRALVFTDKDYRFKEIENTKVGFIPHFLI